MCSNNRGPCLVREAGLANEADRVLVDRTTLRRSQEEAMTMHLERWLRLIAGGFVLASLALGYFHSAYWFLFTGSVGLSLFQSGFTNWCPMMAFLRACGVREMAELKGAQSRE
jgi:hypothetical protein